MKEIAFRLENGDDLKSCIEKRCREASIDTAVVLSGVGSLKKVKIRLAKALNYHEDEEDHEIVSLTGTVSKGKALRNERHVPPSVPALCS